MRKEETNRYVATPGGLDDDVSETQPPHARDDDGSETGVRIATSTVLGRGAAVAFAAARL